MSDLASELRKLRKGRGVMAGDLMKRIGPQLCLHAGISAADGPVEARDRLMSYLNGLAEALPEDLRPIFRIILGLDQNVQARFLEDRLQWLASELGRDARTINRRFNETLSLLDSIALDRPKEDIGEENRDSGRLGGDHRSWPLNYRAVRLYRLVALPAGAPTRVGFITGDIRRVKTADIWVNPENTRMRMARFDEHSVSAVIRYEGAVKDGHGEVTDDCIAAELAERVAGAGQVAPGAVVVTGAGQLRGSNNVQHVVHVAAVYGEPGEGYRQVRDIGRCVTNVLREADALSAADPSLNTILFPILGVGVGRGSPRPTVETMLGAAIDHLTAAPVCGLTVLFLAYTAAELGVCTAVFEDNPHLAAADDPPVSF